MSHVQRDLDSEALGRVQLGTRVYDGDHVGEFIDVTRTRATVQCAHKPANAAACQRSHWRKVYRRVDGRSVGGKQFSWAHLAP